MTACGQSQDEIIDNKNVFTSDTAANNVSANNFHSNYVDTKVIYKDSEGDLITVLNSLPKGGLKYTDPTGKDYVYAVFWSRIINDTEHPIELTLNSFEESYHLASATDRIFKLYIPEDTLAIGNEASVNYGLNLEEFLNDHYLEQPYFNRIIPSKEANGFYFIILFNKGVEGTLRTGLSIKEQSAYYKVNDMEIECGKINIKNLEVIK